MTNREPTAPGVGENLTSRTLTGLRWTYLSTGVGFAMQMGYQAVVNRLLDPVAFGLMAIAVVVMQFSRYFVNLGVVQAIVQKPELDDDDLRTGFTATMLLGVGVVAVLWVAAPLGGRFFGDPALTPVIRSMGGLLLIMSFLMVSEALLRRQLRFRELAIIEMASYAVGFLVVGVGLAALGAGVWSLVAAYTSSAVVAGIIIRARVRHPMRPLFDRARFRTLYGFGGRVSVIQVMEFFGQQLDTIAVGRFASTSQLGQYSRAYLITHYPINKLTQALSNVLFPGFSRVQHDLSRARRAYLDAVSPAAFLLVPVCAGVAVAAPEVVRVVLGPQWDAAAAIVPILAIAIAFKVVSQFPAVVSQALAELNKKMLLQASFLVVFAGLLLLARGHGLWAYAAALSGAEGFRFVLYQLLMRRMLDISWAETARAYAPALLAGTVVAALVGGGRYGLLALDAPTAGVLVAEMALGAAALFLVLRFGPLARLRRMLRRRLAAAGDLQDGNLAGRLVNAALGPR